MQPYNPFAENDVAPANSGKEGFTVWCIVTEDLARENAALDFFFRHGYIYGDHVVDGRIVRGWLYPR